MALVFPISASVGQTYQSGSSITYEWTGTHWRIKNTLNLGAFVTTSSLEVLSASLSDRIVTATNEGQFATTGSNTFYGDQILSGSLIPTTADGTYTSSFSLGSVTNAWKDLYISHGSIIFVDAVTQETSSFSITTDAGLGTNTVKYTAAITASQYLGDGGNLTNLPSVTNWNKNKMYTVGETEQLTFSGDYILENSYLQILGSDIEIEYSPNKYFKKEGSIFIGGNLLLKDSTILNNGKISVGGEVILIGDSQITGTGTII